MVVSMVTGQPAPAYQSFHPIFVRSNSKTLSTFKTAAVSTLLLFYCIIVVWFFSCCVDRNWKEPSATSTSECTNYNYCTKTSPAKKNSTRIAQQILKQQQILMIKIVDRNHIQNQHEPDGSGSTSDFQYIVGDCIFTCTVFSHE